MPLRLDIKKKLSARSERVKSVDFHPNEPWVLAALYSGNALLWDYNTQSMIKSIEVSSLPLRCAKFIVRKQWIIAGCDDMQIRVYNYNTLEKVKAFDAHSDYIRHIAVHPNLPLFLTASDDMTVKLWDWEKGWTCCTIFEAHSHYVMMSQWNPKDPHIFASASLDRSIKVWGISASASQPASVTAPHFSLTGHERGVNCIEYHQSGDKPYIVSGSDDKTVRVWDYQTKQCLQVLTGHAENVSAASFHPTLPIILSGGEDGALKIWHASTYRLETTVQYNLQRLWSIAVLRGSTVVGLGFDEGTVVIKLGSDDPIASMTSQGKAVWSRGAEIQTANLRLVDESSLADGERVPLSVKDMGSCELFPQSIAHHPNGRLFAVCGDGEYVIYTAQALRNKSFGQAVEFVWSEEGHYGTRDNNGRVTIFHDFKETFSFKPGFTVEEIFGGKLLGLRGGDFVCFYDWADQRLVQKIEVTPKKVVWAEGSSGSSLLAILCSDAFYVLRFNREAYQKAAEERGAAGGEDDGEGFEEAFELIQEVNERAESGLWVADCFVYVTSALRLQTFSSGQIDTLAHLEKPMALLGFIPEQNRVFLIDRELGVFSFSLHLAMLEYQSAVIRRDDALAEQLFLQIPPEMHARVARFLDHQGFKERALEVTTDPDMKFDLALSLGRLQQCAEIIRSNATADVSPSSAQAGILSPLNISRWKQLGDVALEHGHFSLAVGCFQEANDLSGLLLVSTAMGDAKLLSRVAEQAAATKKANVAFLAKLLLQDLKGCVDVLMSSDRVPEAAFFARTYCPSLLPPIVAKWKEELGKVNQMLANALADPVANPTAFPADLEVACKAEKILQKRRQAGFFPADQFPHLRGILDLDLCEEIKNIGEAEVEKMFLGDAQITDEEIGAIVNETSSAEPAQPPPMQQQPQTVPPPSQYSPPAAASPAAGQMFMHTEVGGQQPGQSPAAAGAFNGVGPSPGSRGGGPGYEDYPLTDPPGSAPGPPPMQAGEAPMQAAPHVPPGADDFDGLMGGVGEAQVPGGPRMVSAGEMGAGGSGEGGDDLMDLI